MAKHCCEDMAREVETKCELHPDRFDCADCLIDYNTNGYGIIIHDGGSSYKRIRYCPWCGMTLTKKEDNNG
jgi:hypothetical protein